MSLSGGDWREGMKCEWVGGWEGGREGGRWLMSNPLDDDRGEMKKSREANNINVAGQLLVKG